MAEFVTALTVAFRINSLRLYIIVQFHLGACSSYGIHASTDSL
jgi:hypothetical protein